MPVYDAVDIIGKTLIAKRTVRVYRGNQVPGGQPFGTVQTGQPVGVVYSFLSPGAGGRVNLWWQFYDATNGAYYAEMTAGAFDVRALREQGVLTVEEKAQEEEIKTQTLPEFFKRNFMKIIYFAGAVVVLKNVLPNLIKK